MYFKFVCRTCKLFLNLPSFLLLSCLVESMQKRLGTRFDNLEEGLGTKVDSLQEGLSNKVDSLQATQQSIKKILSGLARESFGKCKHENLLSRRLYTCKIYCN